MGMDVLYRPSQTLGYTDMLGHLHAADRVLEQDRQAHEVSHQESVDPTSKDPKERQQRHHEERQKQHPFEEEALRKILRSQFNIELAPDKIYCFDYNEETDRIELIDTQTQTILLSLPPETFIQVTQNTRYRAGLIADESA